MTYVFKKESAEGMHVQLSDGRVMLLEELVSDYERLLKEEHSKKEPLKESITSKLKVGEWFRIDREVIEKNQERIRCLYDEEVYTGRTYWKIFQEGKTYWERFQESNKIADENPDQYPRIIETYIFKHDWEYKIEQEMRNMCKEIGDGMCDEVICDLELQMRICNGESVHALFKETDKLPCVRLIQLRNGGSGHFGGGDCCGCPPVNLSRSNFIPNYKNYKHTPYAFRRVLS